MITYDAIKEMNVGDAFKHGTLFPGVTDHKLQWELIELTAETAVFVITFLGAILMTKTIKLADLPKEVK